MFKSKFKAGLTLLSSALLLMPLSATAVPQLFYQGESAGFTLKWESSRLSYGHQKKRNTLFALSLPDSDPDMPCRYDRALRPLSFVGPFVSVEQADSWNCVGTAHPSAQTQWLALDLRQPDKRLKLTDIFDDQAVLKALSQDKIVQQHLAQDPPPLAARSSAELVQQLRERNGQCEYAFDTDMLSHFAFHHIKGNQVAVRMGLSHGCEAARGMLTQLGIYIPMPADWAPAIRAAQQRQQGFLMDWQTQKFGESVATQLSQEDPHYEKAWKALIES